MYDSNGGEFDGYDLISSDTIMISRKTCVSVQLVPTFFRSDNFQTPRMRRLVPKYCYM
jgi:hypothetical protein